MYEYIKGDLVELTPTYLVIETGGIAYFVNISLNTHSQFKENEKAIVYLHQIVRDDAHILYGFADKTEREIFRLLITVSGIGANTGRMILSSLTAEELKSAIETGNVNALKSVKGIGLKTAQRVIIDLKDKIGKTYAGAEIVSSQDNRNRNEALSALVMLGFNKSAIEKALDKIIEKNNNQSVEDLIKLALKKL